MNKTKADLLYEKSKATWPPEYPEEENKPFKKWSAKELENRKKYPEIAKLVDFVRGFFPDAKVVSITQSPTNPKLNARDD